MKTITCYVVIACLASRLECTAFAHRGFVEIAPYTSELLAKSVILEHLPLTISEYVLLMEMLTLCTIAVHPLNFFVPFLVTLSAKRYEVAIVILPRLAPCEVSDVMHV
jgi:hypothetical protein